MSGQDAPEPAPPVLLPEDDWLKLSRKMLLINPVTQLKNLLVPILIALLGTRGGDGGPPWWLFPLLGLVAAVLLGLWQWYTTRYRFTDEQLLMKKGLLSRTQVTAPLDRVRSVDLEASLLHRLLGLSKVKIGTGVDDTRIELDSLETPEANRLRVDLLHRSREAAAGGGTAPGHAPGVAGHEPAGAGGAAPSPAPERTDHRDVETELVRLDPSWLRYAPFGFTGLVAAAGVIGVFSQVYGEADVAELSSAQEWAVDAVSRLSVLLLVAVGLLILLILWLTISTVSYVLSWWNLRVVRHAEGTLHISRGLLTTRSTSLEERRIRGVSLDEPLPLRLVGGARLQAVATGVGSGGTTMLLPPSPLAVDQHLGHVVLEQEGPMRVPLIAHGPFARRRCHFQAQRGALFWAAVLAVIIWWRDWPLPVLALALAPVAIAGWVAEDRYRNLGHGLQGRYLMSRSGVLVRSRVALETDGIIGWTMSQSIFQRRVGLSTLTATTAAGSEGYEVVDVPVDEAVRVADAGTPGMLDDFLIRPTRRQEGVR